MWGAVIGDIVGSKYEFNNIHTKNFKLFNDLKSNETTFTDDTILTMAVIDIILNNNIDDKSKIISTFKKYGLKYPSSYGCSFGLWLHSDISDAYNSFGIPVSGSLSAKSVLKYSTGVLFLTALLDWLRTWSR